jgi:intein-encoded DNA endonuclease-like protein
VILEQDNTGAISNLLRGRADPTSRLKHMDVRFFTISRYIDSGNINVEWTPTDNIVADVLSKPLQGSRFVKLRSVLLGELL